ncbi:hypothetical protein [Nostoc sp.]|uniref:hypothetical protein n=1 Tax=Nostoc sp. TaxID=1180 RepID=UPI002FFA3F39
MEKNAFNKPLKLAEGKERRNSVIPEGRVFEEGVNFPQFGKIAYRFLIDCDRTVRHLAGA